MLVSLVLLILNSIVLYVVPEGRVAYWADWRFWGLTKTEWGDQHVTIGFLFILAGFLHLYYNWAAVISYLKNKVKEIKVFTLPFNVGLIITALVAVMTYFHVPPVDLVLDLGAHFKEAGARKYGEPPYGHAELSSLKMFTQKEGIELDTALSLLQQAGLRVSGADQTLLAVAQDNGMTPQQVYQVISPAKKQRRRPETAPPGLPRRTKTRVRPEDPRTGLHRAAARPCRRCQRPAGRGLTIAAGTTIHEIAETNDREPMQIFEAIRAVVVGE